MFQTNAVDKTKTQVLCSVTFYRKSCPSWGNVDKYGIVGRRQAKIGRMRISRSVHKATNTHSRCV